MNELQLRKLSVIGNVQVLRVSDAINKKVNEGEKPSQFNLVYVRRTYELEQLRIGIDESIEKGLITNKSMKDLNLLQLNVDRKTGDILADDELVLVIPNDLLQGVYNRRLGTGNKRGVDDDSVRRMFNGLTLQLNVEYGKVGDIYVDRNDEEYAYTYSQLRLRGLGYDEINQTDDTFAVYESNKNACKAKEQEIADYAKANVAKQLAAKKKGFGGRMWNQTDETPSKQDLFRQAIEGKTQDELKAELKLLSKDKVTNADEIAILQELITA